MPKNLPGAQGTAATVVCERPGVRSVRAVHSTRAAEGLLNVVRYFFFLNERVHLCKPGSRYLSKLLQYARLCWTW